MDYRIYRFTWRQWLATAAAYAVLDMVIALLFFNSRVAFLIFLPGYAIFAKICAQWYKNRRDSELKMQFREWMMLLYASIAVGISLESAIRDSWTEMKDSHTKNLMKMNYIFMELDMMVKKMSMNVSVTECLEDFAVRSGDEDIYDFFEVIYIARQQGGSMKKIVRDAIEKINDKIEMNCEIAAVIAGKKHEFLIMSVIPLGMIIYMRIGSPELMTVLYTSAAGKTVMAVGLGIYGFAVFWGMKIVRISI